MQLIKIFKLLVELFAIFLTIIFTFFSLGTIVIKSALDSLFNKEDL